MTAPAWIALAALVLSGISLIWTARNAKKVNAQPKKLRQQQLRDELRRGAEAVLADLETARENLVRGQSIGGPPASLRDYRHLCTFMRDRLDDVPIEELAERAGVTRHLASAWSEVERCRGRVEGAERDSQTYRENGGTTDIFDRELRNMERALGLAEAGVRERIAVLRNSIDGQLERLNELDANY